MWGSDFGQGVPAFWAGRKPQHIGRSLLVLDSPTEMFVPPHQPRVSSALQNRSPFNGGRATWGGMTGREMTAGDAQFHACTPPPIPGMTQGNYSHTVKPGTQR